MLKPCFRVEEKRNSGGEACKGEGPPNRRGEFIVTLAGEERRVPHVAAAGEYNEAPVHGRSTLAVLLGRPYCGLVAEIHYYSKLVWSGAVLGATKSVEAYSREFRAEVNGKSALLGSADPAFHGDPALHNPEDLLLVSLSACHMLSYLAVCAHAGILIASYEDSAVGTLARGDGRLRFIDVLLRPKVMLGDGRDIAKAKAMHEKAHDICIIGNSVNFPVRHEAEVTFAVESVADM